LLSGGFLDAAAFRDGVSEVEELTDLGLFAEYCDGHPQSI
jgi:hypothetical protein